MRFYVLYFTILLLHARTISGGKIQDVVAALKTNDLHTNCCPMEHLRKLEIHAENLSKKLNTCWSDTSDLQIQLQHMQQNLIILREQWQECDISRRRAEERSIALMTENERLRQYTDQVWLPPVPPPAMPRKKKSARFNENVI